MPRLLLPVLLVLGLLPAACGGGEQDGEGGGASATRSGQQDGDLGANGAATVATGLEVPWGIAFLPDGDALVSERTTGRILRIPAGGGAPEVAMEVPGVDTGAGEGGLLGLAVSPATRRTGSSTPTSRPARTTASPASGSASEPEPVLTGLRAAPSPQRRADRLRARRQALRRRPATPATASSRRTPSRSNGKILRMEPDGGVPADNPTPGSRVWSLGHRNVQGLAWDDAGRLWATEFGAEHAATRST